MIGASLTAEGLYGVTPSRQPSSTPVAEHAPGEVEPSMRTLPRPTAAGALGNPMLVLVVLLGAAMLILNLSVRGQVSIGVGK